MAIYHLSARIVSRGKGDSAVGAAAYQSRSRIVDERTGEPHNYSRRADELLFAGIYAPKDAPAWAHDRAALWNHVEAFERRADAQVARSFDVALPCELTPEQGRYALQDWVRDNFTRKGLIADVAIHRPGAEGDERNTHAHVLVVMRKLDGEEFAAKKERAATMSDRRDELEGLRESWERIGNRHLERHGFEPTLDRRSLEDQGIERFPTVHLGKDATALEREGTATDRGDFNREIAAANQQRGIDLAVERAMRDARTAAQGRTDDVRPEPVRPEPLQEAAKETTQPVREAEPDAREITPEPANDVRSAGSVIGGFLRGFERMAEKLVDYLSEFLAPAPPPSKDQAERMERAAEEQHQARADEGAQQEKASDLDSLIAEMQKQQQQRDQDLYDRFPHLTRDADRDRDDDFDRGRERSR